MRCRHRPIRTWVCNGVLLVLLISLTGLCFLNLVNPALPTIRCSGNQTDDPSISHYNNGDTVSALVLILVVLIPPLLQLFVTEAVHRGRLVTSFTLDRNGSPVQAEGRWKSTFKATGVWFGGYAFGVISTLFINDIAKSTLNAPRPHFITTCKPNFTAAQCQLGWVDTYECTNQGISSWRMGDSHKSFPSGHAAASMFTAVFMIIYQHSRLNKHRHGYIAVIWCHLSWLAWGVFCSLSRVADRRHHPIDIVVGGLLGIFGAIFTALYVCGNFQDEELSDWQGSDPYHHESGGRVNPGASVLDESSPTDLKRFNSPELNGTVPNAVMSNGDAKRPSLRRLISNQSVLTQMSDIPEDTREIELI